MRKTLYRAAQSAAQHNSHIKADADRYQQKKGEPYKYAMTAVMRKRLMHLQSRLKNNTMRFSKYSCLVPVPG